MDSLSACRVCLATDVKLHSIRQKSLKMNYESLTGTHIKFKDGLPQYICSYCRTMLMRSFSFKAMCLKSLGLLKCALIEVPVLTTDYIGTIDRESYKLTFPYTAHQIPPIDITPKPVVFINQQKPLPNTTQQKPLLLLANKKLLPNSTQQMAPLNTNQQKLSLNTIQTPSLNTTPQTQSSNAIQQKTAPNTASRKPLLVFTHRLPTSNSTPQKPSLKTVRLNPSQNTIYETNSLNTTPQTQSLNTNGQKSTPNTVSQNPSLDITQQISSPNSSQQISTINTTRTQSPNITPNKPSPYTLAITPIVLATDLGLEREYDNPYLFKVENGGTIASEDTISKEKSRERLLKRKEELTNLVSDEDDSVDFESLISNSAYSISKDKGREKLLKRKKELKNIVADEDDSVDFESLISNSGDSISKDKGREKLLKQKEELKNTVADEDDSVDYEIIISNTADSISKDKGMEKLLKQKEELKNLLSDDDSVDSESITTNSADSLSNSVDVDSDVVDGSDKEDAVNIDSLTEQVFDMETLSKQEQLQDVIDRKKSDNYRNSNYKCDKCFKGYVNYKHFGNHLMRHDPVWGSELCDVCQLRWHNKDGLRNHKKHCHERKYTCKLCEYTCRSWISAKEHYVIHSGHKYSCKECDVKFARASSLATHERLIHSLKRERKSEIQVNDLKSFTERQKTLRSARRVSDTSCSVCAVTFKSLEALNKHTSSSKDGLCDTAQKPCEYCGEGFPTVEILQCHQRVRHSDDTEAISEETQEKSKQSRSNKKRPLQYPESLKRFKRSINLKINTSVKPFACNYCERSFSQLNLLRSHVRKVHLKTLQRRLRSSTK